MAYFPFFIDIAGKPCVIAGGGTVALRKLEKLLPFGASVTVIAPKIRPEILRLPVRTEQRSFRNEDLDGVLFAIAATNDHTLNHQIFEQCQARGILCNAVDDRENCGFFFPALAQRGDLCIGISTGGTSPIMARYLREQAEELLDDRTLAAAELMKQCCPIIRKKLHTEAARKEAAERLLEVCFSETPLPDAAALIKQIEEIGELEDQDRDKGQ